MVPGPRRAFARFSAGAAGPRGKCYVLSGKEHVAVVGTRIWDLIAHMDLEPSYIVSVDTEVPLPAQRLVSESAGTSTLRVAAIAQALSSWAPMPAPTPRPEMP